MNEETTVQNDTEELAAETLAAFDEGWEDKNEPVIYDDGQDTGEEESDEADTESESEGTEADADQQEADGNEGGESGEPSEAEGAGTEGSPDQGDTFVLKHLKEEKTVGRDEVIALAQQGLDYPRIREKWDGVKDDLPRLRMYEDFLGRLAQSRVVDGNIVAAIESLIDETNTRTLISEAEANGEELSPAAAAARAVRMRTSFQYEPAVADPVQAEEEQQEKTNREVARFLEEYRDVKAEDIPAEVWEENRKNGGDLVGAYRKYENKTLREEVKQLKKQLEDREQKTKNKSRSTGSAKSEGSGKTADPFAEGWDATY